MEEFLPPLSQPEKIPDAILQEKAMDAFYNDDILDQSKLYEKDWMTLSYNGVPFAPLGGIHALTGQPGNGKTMTFTMLMAAILGGECGGLRYELSEQIPNPKVLYIDTEMEENNTIAVKNRLYSMLKWPLYEKSEQLMILRLRDTIDAADRWRKTMHAIHDFRPTVCFLDGMIDLVNDFNEISQCQPLIYQCMSLASFYHMSLWCLIHENPNTNKMVGHLGSTIQRKVTDVFQTIKHRKGDPIGKGGETVDSTYFAVKQTKARAKDVDDFEFEILQVADWGIPQERGIVPPGLRDLTADEVRAILASKYTKISWPAREAKIKEVLFGREGGVTDDRRQGECLKVAVNCRYLVYQAADEIKPGQRPLLKLNNETVFNIQNNDNQLPF